MPRRSAHHNSDETPVPRRTSARIAAVQAASPAKSPVKSPRRKRHTAEHKAASEDTESQQSQIKSECSLEDLNGLDTGSSTKDRESTVDSQELPPKKSKVDEEVNNKAEKHENVAATVTEPSNEIPTPEEPKSGESAPVDFEMVEKNEVPPSDSAEVKAAVSVQGEDGQLLVGFVQVDKEELPSAASVELKQFTSDVQKEPVLSITGQAPPPALTEAPLNGGNAHEPVASRIPELASEPEVQSKVAPVADEVPVSQPVSAPAAGDSTVDGITSESVSQ